MSPTLAPTQEALEHKHLISDELWGRLTGRIVEDEDVSREQAEQMMDATLGYLELCATHPDRRFTPSEMVDTGWHTFIVYTRAYADFCDKLAGGFIHHEPNDIPGHPQTVGNASATVAFMREHGIHYDPEMWAGLGEKCTVDCDGGRGGSGGGGHGGCS